MIQCSHTRTLFRHVVFISLTTALTSQSFGAILMATNTSSSAVQAAINAASTGDTVLVPAGSSTWSTTVTLAKGIRLIGAGAGKTIVTQRRSTKILNVDGVSAYTQVSGFSFIETGPND